jgi:hypothetical protein
MARREAAMQSWMEVALLVEAGLFAGVLSLFLTWLGMRAFFTLMPASPRVAEARSPQPSRERVVRAA